MRATAPLLLALVVVACGSSSQGDAADAATPVDPETFARPPASCAYTCPTNCAESTTPYVCPSAGPWASIPHEDSCGTWDGTYPAPVTGKCTATAATGDAAKFGGPDPDDATTIILPDGRRIQPAGSDWVFDESDLEGGLTTAITSIPGTSFVLTVDDGPGDHAVRLIDTSLIGSGETPVLSYVKFANPLTLNSGITFIAPDLVYVATDDGVVQAMTFDSTAGTLALDAARTITLPPSTSGGGTAQNWYVASVAASPDGTRLAVTGVNDPTLLVYDVRAGSATFGQLLGSVAIPDAETFGVSFDPNDPTGHYAYVTLWANRALVEVDVSNPAAPAVTTQYATDKDPEGIAFLDARWVVVGDDLGDTMSLVDRTSGTVTSLPVDTLLPGSEPSAMAYDATNARLYVALSGINAIRAFDVDTTQTPPSLTPAGSLATGWWPSGVVVEGDGSVVVANMRGHGTGPRPLYFDIGDSDIDSRMRGGIQRVPAPAPSDLTAGDAAVTANDTPSAMSGVATVSCPDGANDFPIPSSNTAGASPTIQHIFLIIRENKGFDGIFGDFPGVNGDPAYTLKQQPGEMDEIWANFRSLARTFATSDNYYTDAIYSTQGHVWATYGRTNDFNERTWAISGSGRDARPVPGGGIFDEGRPQEGSLFEWLAANDIVYDILGEIDGDPVTDNPTRPAIDGKYPGGPIQNIGSNDLPKACYIAARARVLCNLGNFTYATLPNDHTFGISPTDPTPETFCAINDEATGMFVDALSHSPLWASSLVFITEDDPSQGGEHVDSHRAPIVVLGPWVKRGYVSHTHFDMASLHKLFANALGKPYRSVEVANAAIPYDLFTSTPDYAPYTYSPHTWPIACGPASEIKDAEKRLQSSWDLDEPDEQPGLDAQVTRWMRGQQFDVLPPEIEAHVKERPAHASPSAARASRTLAP